MASLDPVARLTTSTGRSRNSSSRSAIRLASRVLGGGGATRRCWYATWRSLAAACGRHGGASPCNATRPRVSDHPVEVAVDRVQPRPGAPVQTAGLDVLRRSGSGSSGLSIRLSRLTDRKFAARQAASINPSPPDSAAPARCTTPGSPRSGPRSVSVVIPVNRRYLTTGLDSTGVPGTGATWSARSRAEAQARPLRTERRCTGISPRTSPLCSTT